MRPYYEEPWITIYHGDCLTVLPALAESSVDVCIADPPYGHGKKRRAEWMVGERSNIMPLVLPEIYRVCTKDGALYLFTGWKQMADWIYRCSPYFPMQNFIIWDKGRHSGLWTQYAWQFHWEGIYFGIKGPRRMQQYSPDVIRCHDGPVESMQKPISLIKQIIEASSQVEDHIIDPFMGTGSTLMAAKHTHRHAIGIEIDERYCEIAVNRLRQGVFPFSAA